MKHLLPFLLILFLNSCEEAPSEQKNNASANTLTATKIEPPTVEKIEKEIVKINYDYDTTLWFDIHHLDTSIIVDMRYATVDNFVKEKMYECGRCLLRPRVARKIVEAHKMLQEGGLGLKMLDCYRPRPVQQKLWDKFQNPRYVTPPSKGSMHNKGAAVDLTIVDPEGNQLDMGTIYDYFGKEAHHAYTDFPKKILANRKLLKETMAAVELKPITTEWWHYSYQGKSYPLSDMLWNCE